MDFVKLSPFFTPVEIIAIAELFLRSILYDCDIGKHEVKTYIMEHNDVHVVENYFELLKRQSVRMASVIYQIYLAHAKVGWMSLSMSHPDIFDKYLVMTRDYAVMQGETISFKRRNLARRDKEVLLERIIQQFQILLSLTLSHEEVKVLLCDLIDNTCDRQRLAQDIIIDVNEAFTTKGIDFTAVFVAFHEKTMQRGDPEVAIGIELEKQLRQRKVNPFIQVLDKMRTNTRAEPIYRCSCHTRTYCGGLFGPSSTAMLGGSGGGGSFGKSNDTFGGGSSEESSKPTGFFGTGAAPKPSLFGTDTTPKPSLFGGGGGLFGTSLGTGAAPKPSLFGEPAPRKESDESFQETDIV